MVRTGKSWPALATVQGVGYSRVHLGVSGCHRKGSSKAFGRLRIDQFQASGLEAEATACREKTADVGGPGGRAALLTLRQSF